MFATELAPQIQLFTSFAFILGCCIGSFMNVVVWRLPRGEKLSYPPSHCPKCGHTIRPWENIPIISWLCLRARCSSCHLPISIKYPLGEAATGILFTIVFYAIFKRNLPIDIIPAYFYLTASLLAAALIDAEHKFIPDKITLSGMVFALATACILPAGRFDLWHYATRSHGWLIFSGLYSLLQSLGLPDISLRTAAICDCIFGALFGYSLVFIFSQALKILLPHKKINLDKPTGIRISAEGIRMENKDIVSWDELLPDDNDAVIIHGHLKDSKTIVKVSANSKSCYIDGQNYDFSTPLKLTAQRISTPVEPIGYGDTKLFAMLGAFLGADATVYILFASAILGLVYAGVASIIKRRIVKDIPFGPAIAVASLIWMLLA